MPPAILLIALGAFVVYIGIKKPTVFWNNRKAVQLRKLFGDNAVAVFYSIIGIIVIILGIISFFQNIM